MEISKKLASQIVEAVYEVVKKDTNLIQPSGLIIGSTDRSRIGYYTGTSGVRGQRTSISRRPRRNQLSDLP